MNLISRADAAKKIRDHWLSTYTREQLLAEHEPDWDRLRNYELEQMLEEAFGGDWCINEWCPFNDVYCRWFDHAPPETIDQLIVAAESRPDELRAVGINPAARIAYLRGRATQRHTEGTTEER